MHALQLALVAASILTAEPAPSDTPNVTTRLGKGVDFTTSDGEFRFNLRGRLQLRGSQFSEDEGDAPNVTEFQARRIRVVFQGHAREVEYYLQLAFSNLDTEQDLRLPLRDAYLTWARWRDLNIRGGQMKAPLGRQRVISSSALQMVDRSIVMTELNLDRDVGVQLFSSDLFGLGHRLGYHVGLFHGDGRNRVATQPGVLVVARIVVRPFGEFEEMQEADFARSLTPKLSLGLSAARNDNTPRPRSTFANPYAFARFDYNHGAADVHFKYRGFSLLAEALYRHATRPVAQGTVNGAPATEIARNAWGYFAQAGYLFDDHLEATARYGELRPVGTTTSDLRERNREVGVGLNWYFQKHDLKLQSDYFFLSPDDPREGRHQLRVQAQLYF